MTFDIHALDEFDSDADNAQDKAQQFKEDLIECFSASPEAAAFLEHYPDGLSWAASFVDFGFGYLGYSPTCLTLSDARELLEDLFPAKILLAEPEDADSAISELIAFWQFLQRQFQLKQAERILQFLEQLRPRFPSLMNDSSRFGLAKSLFAMGQAAGFDMTDQRQRDTFRALFNATQRLQQSPPSKGFAPLPRVKQTGKKKRKK